MLAICKMRDISSCFVSYYCLGLGSTSPTGLCSAGYYCSGGSASPVQHQVEEGHYSVEGAVKPEPCSLGTFQPVSKILSRILISNQMLCFWLLFPVISIRNEDKVYAFSANQVDCVTWQVWLISLVALLDTTVQLEPQLHIHVLQLVPRKPFFIMIA